MKLAPDVIFYSNMIITAGEKASNDKELASSIDKELKKWKISKARALESIDLYSKHISEAVRDRESLPKANLSDPIYLRHKLEISLLLKVKKLLK